MKKSPVTPRAPVTEEVLMPPALAQRLAGYERNVQDAITALNDHALTAICALGVEGTGLQFEILADPPRFRIVRDDPVPVAPL